MAFIRSILSIKEIQESTEYDLKSILCAVYYVIQKSDNDICKKIVKEYENEISEQSKFIWPIVRIKNVNDKKIITLNREYNKTNNMLVMLLRIVYFENLKENNYVFGTGDKIQNLTVREIFCLAIKALQTYCDTYDENTHEYKNAYNLLKYINFEKTETI
jgi:hypothetical protein